MPVGKQLDPHDEFRLALGAYYKTERDRTEACLSDIIDIVGNAEPEEKQVQQICDRLTTHYTRKGS